MISKKEKMKKRKKSAQEGGRSGMEERKEGIVRADE